MLGQYTSVGVGVLTLLVAGFTAYGITNLNTEIQATEPEPISMPDYSDYLNSLDSQIRSIKNDLTILKDLRSDVSEIQQKISELEKTSVVPTVTPPQAQQQMVMYLDRTSYLPGDTIKITVMGIGSQKMINVQIVDDDDFVVVYKDTWADSTGKVLFQLKLSEALPPGNYLVRMASEQKSLTEPIRIREPEDATSIPVDQYIFTVKTNKSLYQKGEIIEVSGTGKPNTQVSATLTSPSGKTFSTTSSTQSDSKFTIFFSTSSNYEDGKWYVTVSHVAKTIVVAIEID